MVKISTHNAPKRLVYIRPNNPSANLYIIYELGLVFYWLPIFI